MVDDWNWKVYSLYSMELELELESLFTLFIGIGIGKFIHMFPLRCRPNTGNTVDKVSAVFKSNIHTCVAASQTPSDSN
jgi:hypothetical protein